MSESGRRFEPRKMWAWATPLGTYEIFQDDAWFNAWFTSGDSGVLVWLGRSKTDSGARRRCKQHARYWRKRKAAQ